MDISLKPIGIIHSPFKHKEDIDPERNKRPNGFDPIQGELEIHKEFAAGLQDIDGFSHLIVIFVFHKSEAGKLCAQPPFGDRERGIFATRSPHRPNPVGMTVVKLLSRQENILRVAGVDMLDETPILDIKPYTPRELKAEAKFGWLAPYLDSNLDTLPG
jgi:tRNA-Thr(GGU) m(6)t(6)A37 methyltransferase TsaA